MTSFHKSVSTAKKDQEEKKNTAVSKLEQFLLERRGARQSVDDLQEFERELHSLFAVAEAEVVGHEVERFDIDLRWTPFSGPKWGVAVPSFLATRRKSNVQWV